MWRMHLEYQLDWGVNLACYLQGWLHMQYPPRFAQIGGGIGRDFFFKLRTVRPAKLLKLREPRPIARSMSGPAAASLTRARQKRRPEDDAPVVPAKKAKESPDGAAAQDPGASAAASIPQPDLPPALGEEARMTNAADVFQKKQIFQWAAGREFR